MAKRSHKSTSLSVCFKKLKDRSLNYIEYNIYIEATKALYGEGEYMLALPYNHFSCSYDDFGLY